MTDTTEAPSRIWICDEYEGPSYYWVEDEDDKSGDAVEYARSDLLTAVEAERLKAERSYVVGVNHGYECALDQAMDIARLAYTGDADALEIADQIDELRAALKDGE